MTQPDPGDSPILVTVIGGYLGAGKTTILNHILRNADERVAVLVNDFGDINIDADLVESDDGDTISLANGCICCSLVDGFASALAQVRALDPQPQRLVIEASGVANPGQVTAYAHGPGFALDGTIVVADSEQLGRQLRNEYIADVIEQQLASADIVVANKADLVEAMGPVVAAIAKHTEAKTVPAISGQLPLDVLLGLGLRELQQLGSDETPFADDRFRSWAETSDEPIARNELERKLRSMSDTLVRAKGIVRLAESPEVATIVQLAGSHLSMTSAGSWAGGASRLVYIELVDPA